MNTVILGRYDLVANSTNDEITRFFIVGDWGGSDNSPYTTPSEVVVAGAMGKLGQTLGTTFQLALGDNFYTYGVKSTSDPRFQAKCFSLQKISKNSNIFFLLDYF